MKPSSEYKIAFRGLSDGSHDFNWEIGKSFFENISESEIRDAEVSVDLVLTKSGRLFNLHFVIKGSVTLPCDRCLDDLVLSIEDDRSLIVRESERGEESNDDILFVSPRDYELDLHQSIYDYIILSLPMRKVHKDGQCNSEMMEHFQDIQIEEADDEL